MERREVGDAVLIALKKTSGEMFTTRKCVNPIWNKRQLTIRLTTQNQSICGIPRHSGIHKNSQQECLGKKKRDLEILNFKERKKPRKNQEGKKQRQKGKRDKKKEKKRKRRNEGQKKSQQAGAI